MSAAPALAVALVVVVGAALVALVLPVLAAAVRFRRALRFRAAPLPPTDFDLALDEGVEVGLLELGRSDTPVVLYETLTDLGAVDVGTTRALVTVENRGATTLHVEGVDGLVWRRSPPLHGARVRYASGTASGAVDVRLDLDREAPSTPARIAVPPGAARSFVVEARTGAALVSWSAVLRLRRGGEARRVRFAQPGGRFRTTGLVPGAFAQDLVYRAGRCEPRPRAQEVRTTVKPASVGTMTSAP